MCYGLLQSKIINIELLLVFSREVVYSVSFLSIFCSCFERFVFSCTIYLQLFKW